jgi:hypothetical protein
MNAAHAVLRVLELGRLQVVVRHASQQFESGFVPLPPPPPPLHALAAAIATTINMPRTIKIRRRIGSLCCVSRLYCGYAAVTSSGLAVYSHFAVGE